MMRQTILTGALEYYRNLSQSAERVWVLERWSADQNRSERWSARQILAGAWSGDGCRSAGALTKNRLERWSADEKGPERWSANTPGRAPPLHKCKR